MTLNIAWLTSRKDCCFEWFAESLKRETGGDFSGIKVIVVDFWSQVMPHLNWTQDDVNKRAYVFHSHIPALHTPPKPTPHQGPYRLTKNDYFAAANARNTALCYANEGWIAYADDLSVLMPGWLSAVREAMRENRITCGAFRKVKKMKVAVGKLVDFEDHPSGWDSRWKYGDDTKAVEAAPNWLFGCSLVAPVEAFMKINGWPEMSDSTGIGMEDCHTGIALGNNGYKLWYDRRMLTYESEEHHHNQFTMLRVDKRGKSILPIGDHPNEKGHFLVNNLKKAKRFTNYFEEGGIAALRQKILSGKPFPNVVLPDSDWFDGTKLSEL